MDYFRTPPQNANYGSSNFENTNFDDSIYKAEMRQKNGKNGKNGK